MIRTAISPKPKLGKCKNPACRKPFEKRNMAHVACSPACAIELSKAAREKKARADYRARKKAQRQEAAQTKARLLELKPRRWWKAKAKKALHAYIRARDEGKTCISCDAILVKMGRTGGDYDAGHFRSVSSAAHLEFVEENIHGQCKHCNNHLSGNRDGYELGLIARYGQEFVDRLKSDQAPRHYTIEDFKAIEGLYKAKLKELKKERAGRE